MCRPARLDLTRSHAEEMAFILEHAPELASHRRIVAPVPKAPPHATAPPFGFERGQIFSTDEPAVIHEREQDQQV